MKRWVFHFLLSSMILLLIGCGGSVGSQGIPVAKSTETHELAVSVPTGIRVETTGYGLNVEEAEKDAILRAIQQAVGFAITGRTIVANYTLLDKSTFTKTRGYVKSYSILEQGVDPSGLVWVKIEACVEESVGDDVEALIRMMNKPRVGVVIVERGGGISTTAVTAISGELNKKGFYIVSPTLDEIKGYLKELMMLSPLALKRAGEALKVDLLVLGSVETEDLGDVLGYGLNSSRARMELKAIWTGSTNVVYAENLENSAADLSQDVARSKAVKEVAKLGARKLADKILEDWLEMAAGGIPFTLRLQGVDYELYKAISEGLKHLSFVKGVFPRSFNDESKTGELDMEIVAPIDWIMERLAEQLGFTYRVKELMLTSGTIEVKLEGVSS